MSKKGFDTIVFGFALFAMFLGAGNVIFPPFLGHSSGISWLPAAIGFLLTGVGLPLLGVVAASVAGGTIDDFGKNVSPNFGKIFGTVIILAIGPFLAIPRTGATAFELGVVQFIGNSLAASIITTTIFFGITLFFVLNPSSVIDRIGRYLTPVLVVILGAIVVGGVINPMGAPVDMEVTTPFRTGFTEGYQTMDALGSFILATIIIISLKEKGYKTTSDQVSMTIKAGIIAATGLGLIYAGLIFIGATSSSVFSEEIQRTALLIGVSERILGTMGTYALGISVFLACLTTSIGLTTTAGRFFHGITNGKLDYKLVVWLTVLFSLFIANAGVESIVMIAEPPLVTIYPVAIVLIIMTILDNYIKDKVVYKGAVLGAFIIGLVDSLMLLDVNLYGLENITRNLPFAEYGVQWIVPAIVFALVFKLIKKINTTRSNKSSDTTDIN
ncbi:branched-chain amino acid transport system II carrier protein [Natranaerobius trueperi]|uniref:Branched-chain amino acid transport system carrier protein n=1 Tax=Natranaerobius trueperi TaxID=759412 RepID=A0A226BYI7_9FIRM|nr:branched-chain amino acid transport system II carrier protein [Natranaerobius trueperi]OWZ83177.1 branched-chain amino acid transport system II carrier protein [Natranaerobius trueperi]